MAAACRPPTMTAVAGVRSLVALVVLLGGVPAAAFVVLRGVAAATGPPDEGTVRAWLQRRLLVAVGLAVVGPAAATAAVGPAVVAAVGAAASAVATRTGVAVAPSHFVGPLLGTAGFLALVAGVVGYRRPVDRALSPSTGAEHAVGWLAFGFAVVATAWLARLAVVVAVPDVLAAVIVATGWLVYGLGGLRLSFLLNEVRPLPPPWDERVARLRSDHDVRLGGAWLLATDFGATPKAEVVGVTPGTASHLFVTDRLLEVLDPEAAEAVVRRALVVAERGADERRFALHALVTVGWAASFQFVSVGTGVLLGLAAVVPYRLLHRWLHRRELYAADDAVAAAGYREELVDAVVRVGEVTGRTERRDPLVDLFLVEPTDERRLQRLGAGS